MAILYCRGARIEQIHGQSQERLIDDATTMLRGLTDAERRDWSLVIIQRGRQPKRLFGPTI